MTKAPQDGTLGALRELTADLPDDTPIAVWVRKAHDADDFYERLMVALVVGVTTLAALVTFAVGEAMALGNEQHHVAAYTLGVGAITFGIAVLSALFAWGTK